MLALEDNWATYEPGTEHTAPNYESMGTGNRFRLLFGQSYPTEVRTNQSAKYTHTLFVTLNGTPSAPELPELLKRLASDRGRKPFFHTDFRIQYFIKTRAH